MDINGAVSLEGVGNLPIINTTDIPTEQVESALADNAVAKSIQKSLLSWSTNNQKSRQGGIFNRDKYLAPKGTHREMEIAYEAVKDDDIVGGVADSTEALAFSKVAFFADDPDEENIWNQIAEDLDLETRLREMWRELFTVSQFVAAVWWDTKTYTVQGRSLSGVKRKKQYKVRVPTGITLLDPLKVVPVGNFFFGQERLVYIADQAEKLAFDAALENPGSNRDPLLDRLIEGKYEPKPGDAKPLEEVGLSTRADNLYLLREKAVFRHTLTRPGFQPFATVRMKSVFELLDIKHQLRHTDRTMLLANTNFLLLVRIGSDERPGKQAEINALRAQVHMVGQSPVLVGDSRLQVDIVTPKTDMTLKSERHDVLDDRIRDRLYLNFVGGGAGQDRDTVKMAKVIASGMESRRHMLARALEREIFIPAFERNDSLESRPKLKYKPRNIALEFDQAYAALVFDARAQRLLSRETALSEFDFDQDDEARNLLREKELFDDIFQEQVPFSAPQPNEKTDDEDDDANTDDQPVDDKGEKRRAGRRGGGNRNGGGAAPGSGQGQEPRNPRKTSD